MSGEVHRQHHFQDMEQQAHASRLGMWLFLGTEVLLFAGLFVGYAYYRSLFPEGWRAASGHLERIYGTMETFDLVTSSFFMVGAIHLVRRGRTRAAVVALGLTMAMGLAFLFMHGTEYFHEWKEGLLPGRFFHNKEVTAGGASMFMTVYFFMTGLHSIHVLAGVLVLAYLTWRTLRGGYSADYHTPLELGGLYWHLVDMIWIFLFPLLYLV
jgi:cytochrome c oxidase subunit 3